MYPAAALWDEVAGIHVDQSAPVLRDLKLATSEDSTRVQELIPVENIQWLREY
jgi:hypothetical protein